MTLLIVRLRLAMWRTAMSRSALQLTSSIVGGLAALTVVGILGPALVLLAGQPVRITALVVPLFTVATLMWAVLSLIATGVDSILDPARFAVLPLRAHELARGLLAAALTGIPALMLCCLALAQVGAWAASPATAAAALLAAVLGVLTAVLLSRAVTSALARVMTTRFGRILVAEVIDAITMPLDLPQCGMSGRGGPMDMHRSPRTGQLTLSKPAGRTHCLSVGSPNAEDLRDTWLTASDRGGLTPPSVRPWPPAPERVPAPRPCGRARRAPPRPARTGRAS